MSDFSAFPVQTRRVLIAHVSLCRGCCCGQVERGRPEVPVDWMKEEWKRRGLKKSMQLTISGCLGPCDIPNVVSISSAERSVWLGRLRDVADYAALLEWATDSRDAGRVLPLPRELSELRFDPFRREVVQPGLHTKEAIEQQTTLREDSLVGK